jgi:hypothetical protein
MLRFALALACPVGFIGFASGASAAPTLTQTQTPNPNAPIIQVDHHCGPGHHYVPRRHVRGHDGHMHWVGGTCVRNAPPPHPH